MAEKLKFLSIFLANDHILHPIQIRNLFIRQYCKVLLKSHISLYWLLKCTL